MRAQRELQFDFEGLIGSSNTYWSSLNFPFQEKILLWKDSQEQHTTKKKQQTKKQKKTHLFFF